MRSMLMISRLHVRCVVYCARALQVVLRCKCLLGSTSTSICEEPKQINK